MDTESSQPIFDKQHAPISSTIEQIQVINEHLGTELKQPHCVEAFLASPERQVLYRELRTLYGKAEKGEKIAQEERNKLYKDLTQFVNADPNNKRIFLYLPLNLIPDKVDENSSPKQLTKEEKDIQILLEQSWRSFIGDTDAYTRELAVGLIPKLIDKGIVNNFTASNWNTIFTDTDGRVVNEALKLLPAMLDKGIVTKNNFPYFQFNQFLIDPNPEALNAISPSLFLLLEKQMLSPQSWRTILTRADWYVQLRAIDLTSDLLNKGILHAEDIPTDLFTDFFQNKKGKSHLFNAIKTLPTLIEKGTFPLSTWRELMSSSDLVIHENAIRRIPELFEKKLITEDDFSLADWKKLLNSKEKITRVVAAEIINQLANQSILNSSNFTSSEWTSLLNDSDKDVRYWALQACETLFKKNILNKDNFPSDTWKTLLHSEPRLYKDHPAITSIPFLMEQGIVSYSQWFDLLHDPDKRLKLICAEQFSDIYKRGIITDAHLNELIRFDDRLVRNIIIDNLFELFDQHQISKEKMKELGFTIPDTYLPRGIFQNFQPEEFAKQAAQVYNIVKKIGSNYPIIAPGMFIAGSGSKGYWRGTSDIDWSLIIDEKMTPEEITTATLKMKEEAETLGISLCECHYITVTSHDDPSISSSTDINNLNLLSTGEVLGGDQFLKIRDQLINEINSSGSSLREKVLKAIEQNSIEGHKHTRKIMRPYPSNTGEYQIDDEKFRRVASLVFISKVLI